MYLCIYLKGDDIDGLIIYFVLRYFCSSFCLNFECLKIYNSLNYMYFFSFLKKILRFFI